VQHSVSLVDIRENESWESWENRKERQTDTDWMLGHNLEKRRNEQESEQTMTNLVILNI